MPITIHNAPKHPETSGNLQPPCFMPYLYGVITNMPGPSSETSREAKNESINPETQGRRRKALGASQTTRVARAP